MKVPEKPETVVKPSVQPTPQPSPAVWVDKDQDGKISPGELYPTAISTRSKPATGPIVPQPAVYYGSGVSTPHPKQKIGATGGVAFKSQPRVVHQALKNVATIHYPRYQQTQTKVVHDKEYVPVPVEVDRVIEKPVPVRVDHTEIREVPVPVPVEVPVYIEPPQMHSVDIPQIEETVERIVKLPQIAPAVIPQKEIVVERIVEPEKPVPVIVKKVHDEVIIEEDPTDIHHVEL